MNSCICLMSKQLFLNHSKVQPLGKNVRSWTPLNTSLVTIASLEAQFGPLAVKRNPLK